MRLFGYARVSTSQQSLGIQIKALKEAGVSSNRIFTDKATGTHAEREGIKFGRKRIIDREKIIALRANRIGAAEIAKQVKIGTPTVYKLLKEAGGVI